MNILKLTWSFTFVNGSNEETQFATTIRHTFIHGGPWRDFYKSPMKELLFKLHISFCAFMCEKNMKFSEMVNHFLCIVVIQLHFLLADVTCTSWPMVWKSLGRLESHWLLHLLLHGCLSISASGRGSAGLAKWVGKYDKYIQIISYKLINDTGFYFW